MPETLSFQLFSDEDFERFSGEFKCLYDDQELKEAEQRFRLARLSSIRRGRRDSHRNTDSFTSTAGDENDQLLREILREQAEAAKTGNNNSGTGTMTNGSSSSASSSSGTSPYIAS
jgi:translation initiation factor 2 beta subunit (eIF-2beta)/eIF-5